MRKIAKATVLAALLAGAPALALAADNATRGAGAGNTETNPQTRPSGSFNQGDGGVGNQGDVRGTPRSGRTADRSAQAPGSSNTESAPAGSPPGSFNQGVGGVGNQGQVGGNPRGGAASTQTRDRQTMQQQCGGMTGAARDNCMRDYRAGAANRGTAGDPQSRDFNKGSGGTGGTPPQ